VRIRALKPGFFKNEQLAELSPWHRLCFQGLWLCADRAGRLQDRPKRLKAEIFPYDDLDVNTLLWDLAQSGFIVRYAVGGHPYVWIPTWDEHQHPRQDEHPSALPAYAPGCERVTQTDDTSFPIARPVQLVERPPLAATVTDPSLPSDGDVTAQRMGQVEVGQVEVGDGTSGNRATARASDLLELWNATVHPPIPKCRELNDERRRRIRSRLQKRPSLTEWREAFEKANGSAFCRGEAPTKNGDKPWVVTFDWIIRNDTNAAKVLEGNYDDRAAPSPAPTNKRIEALLRGGAAFLAGAK
jgi:hypothetical protein